MIKRIRVREVSSSNGVAFMQCVPRSAARPSPCAYGHRSSAQRRLSAKSVKSRRRQIWLECGGKRPLRAAAAVVGPPSNPPCLCVMPRSWAPMPGERRRGHGRSPEGKLRRPRPAISGPIGREGEWQFCGLNHASPRDWQSWRYFPLSAPRRSLRSNVCTAHAHRPNPRRDLGGADGVAQRLRRLPLRFSQ